MRYFGVTVASNFASDGTYRAPIAVHAADGRFRVAVPAGTWDLVVAGPGFARRVIPGNVVDDGATVDLGDVVVRRGHTVQGVVRDDLGAPVPGADVHIGARRLRENDLLSELAVGSLEATTDRDGHYRIDGVAAILLGTGPLRLQASRGDEASPPVTIADADATIDLVIGATGSIDVAIVKAAPDDFVVVQSVGTVHSSSVAMVKEGLAHLTHVPIGTYDIALWNKATVLATQRATVTADTTTTLRLAPP